MRNFGEKKGDGRNSAHCRNRTADLTSSSGENRVDLQTDVQSGFLQNRFQECQTLFAGFLWPVHVRIQLQTDVPAVVQAPHGRENISELYGSLTGDQMLVNPAGGNVFDVNVADPFEQLFESRSRVFSSTIEMANVKIQSDDGRTNIFDKRKK